MRDISLADAHQTAVNVVNPHGAMIWNAHAAKRRSVAGRSRIVYLKELPRCGHLELDWRAGHELRAADSCANSGATVTTVFSNARFACWRAIIAPCRRSVMLWAIRMSRFSAHFFSGTPVFRRVLIGKDLECSHSAPWQ